MLHLKLAWRQLRKHRFFSLLNLLGLTVGMTAAMALFLYVQKEYAFDRYHHNADQIVRVNLKVADGDLEENWASAPNIAGPALKEAMPEVKAFVRLLHHNFGRTASVAFGNKRFSEERLFWADSAMLEVFDVSLIAGDRATVLDRPKTAMLNASTAKRIFGEQSPIGQQLLIDNESSVEVTGVYADFPDHSSWQPNIIGSFSSVGWAYNNLYWSNASYETFLLLRPGFDLADIDTKMQAVLGKAVAPENQWFSLWAQPLKDIHLYSSNITSGYASRIGDARQVRLMGMLALVVLLLACFNYINLTTARSQQRLREVGISKAIGASTRHMVSRFLTETALLTGLAVALSIGLLTLVTPSLSALTQRDLQWQQLLENGWWLTVLATWLIVTLVAGVYPALALGMNNAKQLLQPIARQGSGHALFRKVLVVGQFVVCIALIAGALLCQKQITYLGKKKLGYGVDAVVAINLAGSDNEAGKTALEKNIAQQPGIEKVARAQAYPGIGTSGYAISDPNNPQVPHRVLASLSEPGSEDLLGLELLAGKFITAQAEGDTTIDVVVNEQLISIFGWTPEEAIGRTPGNMFDSSTKIVGVVKDFHFESLHHPIGAYALHNDQDKANPNFLLVRVRPDALNGMLPKLANLFREYLPEAAFDYTFLDQTVAGFYENETRLSRVVWLFTLLTIFISALGLLGLATFAAAQRTKEISIRKVLGASVGGIVLLLSKDFLWLVLIAVLLAVPLGWWAMQEWLTNFAYRIEIEWWVFGLAGGTALLITFLTIAGQSWRAAVRNPVDALRNQ